LKEYTKYITILVLPVGCDSEFASSSYPFRRLSSRSSYSPCPSCHHNFSGKCLPNVATVS